jgi:hypothetical protein
VPDTWAHPWFAAWDLVYYCSALALIDVDFVKDQEELAVFGRYMHPNAQVSAFEWDFGDADFLMPWTPSRSSAPGALRAADQRSAQKKKRAGETAVSWRLLNPLASSGAGLG